MTHEQRVARAAERLYTFCFQNRDSPLTGASWKLLGPETQREYRTMVEVALQGYGVKQTCCDAPGLNPLDGRCGNCGGELC